MDKSLPFYSRFIHYLAFSGERTLAYMLDILNFRTDPVIFKTTAFIRRNFNRIRSTLAHIWLELCHVGHGFKRMKRDIKFAAGV